MKGEINDLLLKMQRGENCIGETANHLLALLNTNKDGRAKEKYVVKDFESNAYYCGEVHGWSKDEPYLADYFDSKDDAERFINRENGKFQIIPVYV